MKKNLKVMRDNEVKLLIPGPSVTIKADGTLWVKGFPILGIDDPAEKARMVGLVKAGKHDQIPAIYYTRLGDNPNRLWAEWEEHPVKVEQDRKAAEAEDSRVTIYLSSRGWGDYSPVVWQGDITRQDTDILAECRILLRDGHDVDQPNQSDEELISKISKTRAAWETEPARKAAREAAEAEDIRRKIATGYCFACESYCDGDCGHYSKDPMTKFRRDLREAAREANFGIND